METRIKELFCCGVLGRLGLRLFPTVGVRHVVLLLSSKWLHPRITGLGKPTYQLNVDHGSK